MFGKASPAAPEKVCWAQDRPTVGCDMYYIMELLQESYEAGVNAPKLWVTLVLTASVDENVQQQGCSSSVGGSIDQYNPLWETV